MLGFNGDGVNSMKEGVNSMEERSKFCGKSKFYGEGVNSIGKKSKFYGEKE